ncbi:hypothetical protein AB0A74_01885 [Saccharothrix sp. NPDC042600]|uniref:hypothetical protein n=1 Tax=Saccharothrix TaxID=2071 RepID=UPI0033C0332A|nr:hypothetical protein GCM10017745_50950 [Saccharothrix mutabilis subsp. capreolus]
MFSPPDVACTPPHTADRLLNPHRDPIDLDPPVPGAAPGRPADPLAWFDAEHRCLREALHAAADRPRAVGGSRGR